MPASSTLALLGTHIKIDRDYVPVSAHTTQRVHVAAAGHEWEVLLCGPKFYDTRARKGGGGAIDLVTHLWGVPFRQAVKMLTEAGA